MDVVNLRMCDFKLVNEVLTGFFKVVREFRIPEEEKAVWEVTDKDYSFVSLTGRGEKFKVKFREFGWETRMFGYFFLVRAGFKGKIHNATVMLRGEKISAANFDLG